MAFSFFRCVSFFLCYKLPEGKHNNHIFVFPYETILISTFMASFLSLTLSLPPSLSIFACAFSLLLINIYNGSAVLGVKNGRRGKRAKGLNMFFFLFLF